MKIVNKIDKKTVLGIDIGIPNRGTINSDFTYIRKEMGYATYNQMFQDFQLPFITEFEGSVIVYSETLDFNLKPLLKDDFSLTDIKDFIDFYKKLRDKHNITPQFSSNLLYRYQHGIFMMPPKLIEYINERSTLKSKLEEVSIYRNPQLEGEKSLLFSTGILLYIATTKAYPIVYSDVEDLRDKMRRKKFIKPRWKNITISDSLNNLINNLLDTGNELTLDLTSKELDRIISQNDINREDRDYSEEISNNSKKEKSLLTWENRRTFFVKNKGILYGSSIVAFMLIIFFGTIIANYLKPPQTSGFTASQVVETYFECFQTLNPELIEDVLAKGVRKNDSTEISTLYVTTKMRSQSDPTAKLLTPKEWLELDDSLKSKKDVYGINNLEIEEINPNVFKVKYEKWYTQADDTDLSAEIKLGVYKSYNEEIFTMQETKYSYEIINIETLINRSERVW